MSKLVQTTAGSGMRTLSGGALAASVFGSGRSLAAILSLSPFAFYVVRPQDIFTEEDGTGVVAPNGAVGYLRDLSGNGRHLTQATAANRPLYKTSGGRHWVESSDTTDILAVTFGATLNQPIERISAVRPLTANLTRFIGQSGGTNVQLRIQTDLSIHAGSDVVIVAGGPAAGTDFVATERYNGASSRGAFDNDAYQTGDAGAGAADGLSIFQTNLTGDTARFYGLVQFERLLTDSEIALCRTFMASLQGRVL